MARHILTSGRTYLTQKQKQRTLRIRAEATAKNCNGVKFFYICRTFMISFICIVRIGGLDLISIYTWNWGFLISIKLFI